MAQFLIFTGVCALAKTTFLKKVKEMNFNVIIGDYAEDCDIHPEFRLKASTLGMSKYYLIWLAMKMPHKKAVMDRSIFDDILYDYVFEIMNGVSTPEEIKNKILFLYQLFKEWIDRDFIFKIFLPCDESMCLNTMKIRNSKIDGHMDINYIKTQKFVYEEFAKTIGVTPYYVNFIEDISMELLRDINIFFNPPTFFGNMEYPRKNKYDAGFDLIVARNYKILPKESCEIKFMNIISMAEDKFGILTLRSSIGEKCINNTGIIDAGFQSQLKTTIFNISNEIINFKIGDRIGQVVIIENGFKNQGEIKNGFNNGYKRKFQYNGSSGK